MMAGKTAFVSKMVFFVVFALVLFHPAEPFAGDARVVSIYKTSGDNTELRLNPPNLYVKKGTVVIWMNSIMGEEIQVVFRDGKACQDVSFSPEKAFNLDAKSCYVTSFLPYASTSSLIFMQTGTFYYMVKNITGKITGKGKIIVREM